MGGRAVLGSRQEKSFWQYPSLARLFWADRPPQTNEDFSPSANSSYLVLSPEVARNILRQRERQREGDEFGEGNNGLTVAGCNLKVEEVDRRARAGRRGNYRWRARGEICGCAFVSGAPPKWRNESASAKREMK